MSSIKARRISSQERAVSFGRASGKRPDPTACDWRPTERSSNVTRTVTATEATKADGGALGMRLVTKELDAHREESPELIGSEAVEGLAADGATKISIARQLGIGEATVFSSPFSVRRFKSYQLSKVNPTFTVTCQCATLLFSRLPRTSATSNQLILRIVLPAR